MEHELATAAEGETGRRDHHRNRRIPQPDHRALETADHQVYFVPVAFLRLKQHQHEVGAGAEIDGVVADHQPREPFGGLGHPAPQHLHGVAADGVQLRMELDDEHVVPDIDETRPGVSFHDPALPAGDGQNLQVRPGRRQGGGANQPRSLRGVRPGREPGPLPGGGRQIGDAGRRTGIQHRVDADGVEELERAEIPAESPPQGAVDVVRRMGDFRRDLRGIQQRAAEGRPQELPHAIAGKKQGADTLGGVLDRPGRFEAAQLRRLPRPVLHRGRIEGQDGAPPGAAFLPVEPLTRFLPDPAPLDQVADERRQVEYLPFLGPFEPGDEVGGDVGQDVDPRDVHGAERRALRPPDGGTGHGIDFFDGVAPVRELLERGHDPVQADAVADEAGCVASDDDPLPELPVDEGRDGGDGRGVGVGGGNDLDETQITGGIEEVGPQPPPSELRAASLGDGRYRNAGRVRADDGIGPAAGLHPFEQRPLGVEPFDDRFDDPVVLADGRQVGIEPAETDARPDIPGEERVRLEGGGVRESPGRGVRIEIEQQHRPSGVGDLGRDLGAHGAGAQHRDRADSLHHGFVPSTSTKRPACADRDPAMARHGTPSLVPGPVRSGEARMGVTAGVKAGGERKRTRRAVYARRHRARQVRR